MGSLSLFEDTLWVERLIKEIGEGTVLGKILGFGAAVTGSVFGMRWVLVKKTNLFVDLINAIYETNDWPDYIQVLGKEISKLGCAFSNAAGVRQEYVPKFIRMDEA